MADNTIRISPENNLVICDTIVSSDQAHVQSVNVERSEFSLREILPQPEGLVEEVFGTPDTIFFNRRAVISVNNNWKISIGWGTGTYSSNRNAYSLESFNDAATTVEIAVFSGNYGIDIDTLEPIHGIRPKGNFLAEDVLSIVYNIIALPPADIMVFLVGLAGNEVLDDELDYEENLEEDLADDDF